MRKWLPVLVAAALLCLAILATGGAQAKFARCHSFGCVNKKLNAIHKQLNAVRRHTRILEVGVYECEQLVPITEYGDPLGSFGYLFDNDGGSGTLYTSALDFTASGDPTDELMVVDTCFGKTKKPVLKRQIIRPLTEGHRKK